MEKFIYRIVACVVKCYISVKATAKVGEYTVSVTVNKEEDSFSSYTLSAEVETPKYNYSLIRSKGWWQLGMFNKDNTKLLSHTSFNSTPERAVQELFKQANAEEYADVVIKAAIKKLAEVDDDYLEHWADSRNSLYTWCKENDFIFNDWY